MDVRRDAGEAGDIATVRRSLTLVTQKVTLVVEETGRDEVGVLVVSCGRRGMSKADRASGGASAGGGRGSVGWVGGGMGLQGSEYLAGNASAGLALPFSAIYTDPLSSASAYGHDGVSVPYKNVVPLPKGDARSLPIVHVRFDKADASTCMTRSCMFPDQGRTMAPCAWRSMNEGCMGPPPLPIHTIQNTQQHALALCAGTHTHK